MLSTEHDSEGNEGGGEMVVVCAICPGRTTREVGRGAVCAENL